MTSILPKAFKLGQPEVKSSKDDLAKMIAYIKKNTETDAVFAGSFLIRAVADRSVLFDSKGAGMLIEGNLNKFIAWYLAEKKLKMLSIPEKTDFLKTQHVDYVLSDSEWKGLKPVHIVGSYRLYRL